MSPAKKILTTTDGSARSRQVLAHAAALAKASGAEMVLLQVVDPRNLIRRGPEKLERLLHDRRDLLSRVLARTGAWGHAVPTPLLSGEDVPSAILRVAREEGVMLIAMASRGRGTMERAAFGSVAARVIGRSSLPVMVTGPQVEFPPSTERYRILVTSDGSGRSAAVLSGLRPLIESSRISLTLLRVYLPAIGERPEEQEIEDCVRELRQLAAALPPSVAVETVVETKVGLGGPTGVIIAKAAELDANAIALCTHGISLRREVLLGSVALEVFRKSPLPVILARGGGD